jgi:hypothetical protein
MKELLLLVALVPCLLGAAQTIHDRVHDSKVLGEPRHYRIFLPPDYDSSGKATEAILILVTTS